MMFLKDILVLDFETSGIDPNICNPIQIGAVLLDKDSFKIKAEFSATCKPINDDWSAEAEGVHGLSRDFLMKSGTDLSTAIKDFESAFDLSNVIIASWNMFDTEILRRLVGIKKYRNLYKFIELWSYTYPFTVVNDLHFSKERDHGLNDLVLYFDIKRNEKHDALQDAKIEAEIFKLVTQVYTGMQYRL